MPELELLAKIACYVLMGLTVLFAILVVTVRDLFHRALWLAGVLIAIAGIFIALGAEFLAASQILIYVGAIMTLVIFAIMLTGKISEKSIARTNIQWPIGLVTLTGLAFFMIRIITQTPWNFQSTSMEAHISVLALGEKLLGIYIFAFEIISVILLVALIGALVMAKKDNSSC